MRTKRKGRELAELDRRFRSITLSGVDPATAATTMLQVLAAESDLRVDRVGPGRLSVSRTGRPRWATVCAVALFWVGGLGLLFLLVRRTEAQEALVVDASKGCVVTVPPLVDAMALARLEEALLALRRRPVTVGAPAWERIGGADDESPGPPDGLDDRTVARNQADPGAGPAEEAATTPEGEPAREPEGEPADGALVIDFPDGRVEVAPGEAVVLGRDPGSERGRPVTIPGDASTVSKSHLRIEWDGERATITDLHSTNGSSIDDGSGSRPLEPDVETTVEAGTRVTLGATTATTRARARSVS